MSSSSVQRSVPLGPFSAHRLAASGQLTLLWLYSLVGLDVCGVEGEDAAQPIHLAAYNGEKEVVQWLLRSQRLPVTVCTALGWQPVHCAAAGGFSPVLQLLVEEGASVGARTQPQLLTPLMCSAMRGHLRCVRFLVQQEGVEAAAATRDGHTALHFAAAAGHPSVLRLLILSSPSSPDVSPSPTSSPPLLSSASPLDASGRSPLHHAMRGGHVECARVLLHSGADLHRTDVVGLDAFTLAVKGGWVDCVRLAREEGQRTGRPLFDDDGRRQRTVQLLYAAIEAEEQRGGAPDRRREEEEDEEEVEAVDFLRPVGGKWGSAVTSDSLSPPPLSQASSPLLQRLREVKLAVGRLGVGESTCTARRGRHSRVCMTVQRWAHDAQSTVQRGLTRRLSSGHVPRPHSPRSSPAERWTLPPSSIAPLRLSLVLVPVLYSEEVACVAGVRGAVHECRANSPLACGLRSKVRAVTDVAMSCRAQTSLSVQLPPFWPPLSCATSTVTD